MPTFTVEQNWIEVVGRIWMPGVQAAQHIDLSDYDIENMRDDDGKITRESVERWLCLHAGDFASIDDFAAYVKDVEIFWSSEESELDYIDCMFPAEE